jgi:pyrroloquinoline quinone biosynthesis protein B
LTAQPIGAPTFALQASGVPDAQLPQDRPLLIVLGIAQDGGAPQAGCLRPCCADAWSDPTLRHDRTCLALVDPRRPSRWLFECTPDFPAQLHLLNRYMPPQVTPDLAGIFLTHAHIGHYTGLMYLGRESIGASGIPVHAMPRMREFLTRNGPWNQLVRLKNIELRPLEADRPVQLGADLHVTPLVVPHRDEFSETVAFRIKGPSRTALFLPDIDKWDRWERPINDVIASVDVAFVDGCFFSEGELPGRDMSQIPHPTIRESMRLMSVLGAEHRNKVHFIHLNHTNPALRPDSEASREIAHAGFRVARKGDIITL